MHVCMYIYIYTHTRIKILLGCVIRIGVNKCCEVGITILIKVAEFWDIAVVRMRTDISEERITSVFYVENQPSLKTEVIRSSETSVRIYPISQKMATFITTTVRTSNPI
jgi:hypothetical protein